MGRARGAVRVGALTIGSTATTSDALSAAQLRPYRAISIEAPVPLTGTQVTLQTLNGAAVVSGSPPVPVSFGPGETCPVLDLPFDGLQLESDAAEAANRVFPVWGVLR